MISNRTKLSLCQYLDMHALEFLELLFPKHGLTTGYPMSGGKLYWIQDLLNSATPEQIHSLLDEILRTQGDLRSRISPKYKHDERWDDLIRCLTLDGYKVKGKSLTAVDPTVEGAVSFEDDLSKELARSGLADSDKILQMLEKSASAFRATPPNHNDCLNFIEKFFC